MKRICLLFAIFILFPVADAVAQAVISGKVIDAAEGTPIVGATVTVKGTSKVDISNAEGMFRLSGISAGKQTIVIQILGYVAKEESVNGAQSNLIVRLESEANRLEDVVVTGFQNVKKETFAGSSVKLAMDELNLGGSLDVSRMLEGKVAGVSVQSVSSTFGSAPKMRIRGVTSINGENKPLWVVDGVVLEDLVNVSNDQLSSGDPTTLLSSSVAGLSNSDIESFDILKDAAATALYGARAMNGVIVITTKRGKEGAPRISYTGNFTMRTKPRYENFDILNSADQMALNTELLNKGLLSIDMLNWKNFGPYGLMYLKTKEWIPEKNGFAVPNDPYRRGEFLMPYALANTDWFDILFTNKLLQDHSLSISAGTKNSKTYGSLSFMHDGGATIADRVSRWTFNVRNDYQLSKKITTVLQVVGSFREQDAPGSFSRKADPVNGTFSRDFDINPFSYAYNTSRAVRPYDDNGNLEFVRMNYAPFNILHELGENKMNFRVIDVKGQGEFHYEFIKNLKLSAVGALRYVNSGQTHGITERSNVAEAYRSADNSVIRNLNPFLWRDPQRPNDEKKSVFTQGGFYNQRRDEMKHYYVRATLSYNKHFDNGMRVHDFSAFGGTEVKYTDRILHMTPIAGWLFYGKYSVYNPDYYRMLESSSGGSFETGILRQRFRAYFVNADYTFDRRYTISVSGRYDGSNELGKEHYSRWSPTGTVAAKWIVSNERFMERTQHVIDEMALRVSYGLVGSMPPTANSTPIFYSAPTYAPGGYQQEAIQLSALGNVGLTWEMANSLNAGLDITMFGGRFNFVTEYWKRNSFNLIAEIKDSGIGGQSVKMANYANLYMQGFDITIGGTPVKTRDWKLALNFTLGYSTGYIAGMQNHSSIHKLVSQTGGNKNGYPVNSLFSIPFRGFDPENGTPIYGGPDGNDTKDAFLQSTNSDYLKFEGPIDPPYTGGFTTTLSWKGLSATVFISYQAGNVVRLNPSFRENYSDLSALSQDFKNRWMASDGWADNVFAPAILDRLKAVEFKGANTYNIYNYCENRVAKGDFIRLKTVSLSYDIPGKWLERSRVFRNASIRATAKDIWLIYSDKRLHGQDPEFLNTGGVAMPSLPSVIVSLSLGF